MAKILIVEDDVPIHELVKRNLQLVGHQCLSAFDGARAVDIAAAETIDLVLLDVMLPELDGFSVLERIGGTPTIFLTARTGLEHRLKGLSMGADDYIVKPFEMLELLARVDAVLRRTHRDVSVFVLDDVRVELDSRRIIRGESEVDCTPREFELLETLIRNRNIALSREKLLELAWGYDYFGDSRTVDVHIQKLRKKLGWEERIRTVYKLGYRLEVPR